MKHKVLNISDSDLVKELDNQHKLGFELLEVLSRSNPDSRSDVVTWRILFRSVRK